MDDINVNKNNKILIIGIIIFVLFIACGTYAYMILSVDVFNGSYVSNTTCFDVIYDITNDDGTMPITGEMFPSSSAKGGLSGKVSLKIDDGCNICGLGTLKLNVSSNNMLIKTVASHCENSKTLETMTNYTDSSSCTSNGGKWVTNGSALKYAVYDTNIVTNDTTPLSVGYVNKTGGIDIYKDFNVSKELALFNVYIWLDGNLSDNSYIGVGFNGNISSSIEQSEVCKNIAGASEPVLDDGMIPIKLSSDGIATVANTDEEWYNYSNKEWANAVLVKENETGGISGSHSREYYLNNPGATILDEDILAYYVWIPRYKYRIRNNVSCSELDNPTISSNPECFAPYTISDEASAVSSLVDLFSVSEDEARELLNNALDTGYFEYNGQKNNFLDLVSQANLQYGTSFVVYPYVESISLSEEDKEKLSDLIYMIMTEDGYAYTEEEARAVIDNAVETGVISIGDFISIPLIYVITMANIEMNMDIQLNSSVFLLSQEDKDKIISFFCKNLPGYTEEQAVSALNVALNTGIYIINYGEESVNRPLNDFIMQLNDEMDAGIELRGVVNSERNSNRSSFDIKFESKNTKKSKGDAVNTYYTHPAFTFGNDELDGIWAGKFLTSSNSDDNPIILPNVYEKGYPGVRQHFERSLKFSGGILLDGVVSFSGSSFYGLTENVDSHMMKNSEKGAVLYLSQSKYGINSEIYLNNSFYLFNGSYTGRSGGEKASNIKTEMNHFGDNTLSTNAVNNYGYYTWLGQEINSSGEIGHFADDRTHGTNASTTGNVTGVYDMSGAMVKIYMAVLSDLEGNPRSGDSQNKNHSNFVFNGTLDDNTLLTSGIPFPDSKYYDLYLQSQFNGDETSNINFCTLETCGGHALYETVGFYGATHSFPTVSNPWFANFSLFDGNLDPLFSFSGYAGYDLDISSSSYSVLVVNGE